MNIKYITTQNTSFPMDTLLDDYLTKKDKDLLYAKWADGMDKFDWVYPISFRGTAGDGISCEMVLELPYTQLEKVFGKRLAKILVDVAKANTVTGRGR